MDPKVEALASRLKSVLDDYEADRQRQLAARERARSEARAARAALLDDLAAFGAAVGHLQVEARDGEVRLGWGDQRIAFVAEGPADTVRVVLGADGVDSPVRIYRGASDAWVLGVAHDGVEDAEPLFERGLVHLLVEGLGLPVPRPSEPAQPPLDALVPGEDG